MARITLKQGETLNSRLYATKVDGSRQDLTNVTVSAEIKNIAGLSVLKMTVGDGVTIFNAEQGIIDLKAETSQFEIMLHQWDVRFEFIDGNVVYTGTHELNILEAITDE